MPSNEAPFGASPISPSRRQVLAGAGLLAAAGVAEVVPLGGIDGWTPRENTWPLARYDLANTASTAAVPPRDPDLAWSDDRLGEAFHTAVVAGPERVYAGGRGLVALDRADGAATWRDRGVASGRLALRDGTVYSASAVEDPRSGGTLEARNAATGERRWTTDLPTGAASLLVTGGAAFLGYDGFDVGGFDATSGSRRWTAAVPEGASLAVYGGDLYAGIEIHTVTRYRGRDLFDVPLGSGPDVRWESRAPMTDVTGPPVVGSNRVYARQRGRDRPALAACRRASGEVVWTAVPSGSGSERVVGATALAVVEERGGVAGIARESGGSDGDSGWRNRVVGFDPADGAVRWREDAGDRRVSTVAVAANLALVGTTSLGEDPSGDLRAYGFDSGTERWRVDLPAEVTAVAPVEGTAFVACRDGSIHALRD